MIERNTKSILVAYFTGLSLWEALAVVRVLIGKPGGMGKFDISHDKPAIQQKFYTKIWLKLDIFMNHY